jgi:glycosyltransferase involved in cell wall biosynthesis
MELLKDEEGLLFLFIGAGARLGYVQEQVAARQLRNVRFLPHQPREKLADTLAAADVHVVTLLPGLDGLIFPSKLYGILAAARPVLLIGDPQGSVGRWVEQSGMGSIVGVSMTSELAVTLTTLSTDEETVLGFGQRARCLHDQEFRPGIAIEKWFQLLGAICVPSSQENRVGDATGHVG